MANVKSFRCDRLQVFVAPTTRAMAELAAADFAKKISEFLKEKPELNVVFAGAQSQMEFHKALAARKDIEWPRINAFGVDDFWSPGIPRELSVSEQPRRDLYRHVPIKSVHVLDYAAADPEAERRRYEELIRRHRPDLACLGIGVSGHLAFNEPGDTDFADPRKVRLMDVCEASKRQLMADPNFAALGEIPAKGITMTVPALMEARAILCVVPYRIKAQTVRRFLAGEVTTDLPATIVRTHADARLYLDAESFSLCGR